MEKKQLSSFSGGGDCEELLDDDDQELKEEAAHETRPSTSYGNRQTVRQDVERNFRNADLDRGGRHRYPPQITRPNYQSCSSYDIDPDIPGTSRGSPRLPQQGREMRTFSQQVSREEAVIGEQARFFLNAFIRDRAELEHTRMEPVIRDVCAADKTTVVTGFTDENLHDIAFALRRIGDNMSQDRVINDAIEQVPVESSKEIFMQVCSRMFLDGNFNWGRIVALFYFAYRLVVRSFMRGLDSMPWVKQLLKWVIDFLVQNFAAWIISQGGWTRITEFLNISNRTLGLFVAATIGIFLYALYKKD